MATIPELERPDTLRCPVSVSDPDGSGLPVEGRCRPTYQSTVIEGSQFSFQLTPNEYCILLVDAGSLLEPMVVDYVVSLKGD